MWFRGPGRHRSNPALRCASRLNVVILVAASLWFNSLSCAAEPVARNVNVRGLQVGGTTTLTIDGDAFGKEPRLELPFEAQQQLKKGSTDKQAIFDVTLGGRVVPGYYHLRVATDGGISAPIVVAQSSSQRATGMPICSVWITVLVAASMLGKAHTAADIASCTG